MSGYRVEWRDPLDAEEAPSLARCATVANATEARILALDLARRGSVHMFEFHLAVLDGDGRASHRVVTSAAEIDGWVPVEGSLPASRSGTSWSADLGRSDAGAAAVDAVFRAVDRAWTAGAVSREAAARIVAEARRNLDDEDDF